MFTYLHVKNFKSLVDFTINFNNNRNTTRKLNIIYGENGAGKSNIVEIFEFFKRILVTKIAIPNLKIDNENPDIKFKEVIDLIIKQHLIENIISDYKTIECDGCMHVECGIKIRQKNYRYVIETNNERIIYESLSLIQNEKNKCLFEINLKHKNITSVTKNISSIKYLSDEIEKYWGKHSFISIILYEINDKMMNYITKNINSHLMNIINVFFNCSLSKQMNKYGINRIDKNIDLFLEDINNGKLKLDKQYILDTTEKVLNNIVVSLYSDIKHVYYDRKIKKGMVEYKLVCKKLIGNKILDIEFSKESTGTQKLFDIIPLFVSAMCGQIVIIDEFDTGIHDLMIKTLLDNFVEHIKGQLILTTHNTTLMESNIKKDSIYILDILPNRKKEALSLADYDEKLHPNLNIRKRFLSGLYGGIPYTNGIDFNEIEEIINDAISQKK